MMRKTHRSRWAIVLAGGDGTRLQDFTRKLAGDNRPKQFCSLLDHRTLLRSTLDRMERMVDPAQTITVLTQKHQPYYSPEALAHPLVQPANRGTAPAILRALFELRDLDPGAAVIICPSDHHFTNESVLEEALGEALECVEWRPDLTVLLGMTPQSAEVEYGWINPGRTVHGTPLPLLFHVHGFIEKPSEVVAQDLFTNGHLWNSFIIVGMVDTLLYLLERSLPDLYQLFEDTRAAQGALDDDDALHHLYSQIRPIDFSRSVLSRNRRTLAVLPVQNVGWSDLGTEKRVRAAAEARPKPTLVRAVNSTTKPELVGHHG